MMGNAELSLDFTALDRRVGVPDFMVWIESVLVPTQMLRSIMAISVSEKADHPASFSLSVNDPDFVYIDAMSGLFAEGRRVKISLGYVNDLRMLISGEITAVSAELEDGGGLILQVEGFDNLHAAARGIAYRSFKETQSDDAIVRVIAADLHLAADVHATPMRSGDRIQHHVSNLAFLQSLAVHNDYQLWTEDRTLCFKPSRPGPRVELARGRDLISFSARLSTAGQVGAVEVRGWDAGQERGISYRVEARQTPGYAAKLALTGLSQVNASSDLIVDAVGQVRSVEEARARAEALLAQHQRSLFIAEGSAIGNPDLRVGSTVSLSRMGRFSADYVVDTARHEIGPSGYRTTFTMRQHL